MRKLRFAVLFLILLMIPFVAKAESKKINVYIFRGEGCPHCEEALEFFDSLEKDEEYSKYYNLVKYEVWNNKDNAKLMEEVAKAYDEEASGVPYIIIGEKTYSGYSSASDDEIKEAIKAAYNDKEYKDIVKEVKEGTFKSDKDSLPVVPIIIISVVAVAVIILLVVFTKED